LLPRRRSVEAAAALPLQGGHARVEQANALHLAVRLANGGLREARIGRRVGAPVVAKHAEEPDVGIVGAELVDGHGRWGRPWGRPGGGAGGGPGCPAAAAAAVTARPASPGSPPSTGSRAASPNDASNPADASTGARPQKRGTTSS